jgi:hypothetical protein
MLIIEAMEHRTLEYLASFSTRKKKEKETKVMKCRDYRACLQKPRGRRGKTKGYYTFFRGNARIFR